MFYLDQISHTNSAPQKRDIVPNFAASAYQSHLMKPHSRFSMIHVVVKDGLCGALCQKESIVHRPNTSPQSKGGVAFSHKY